MNRKNFAKELEKNKMLLYASDDEYDGYWTFPVMDRKTNNNILKILIGDV